MQPQHPPQLANACPEHCPEQAPQGNAHTCCSCVAPSTYKADIQKARAYNICSAQPPTRRRRHHVARTRTDRLLEEVGVERTATFNSDVRALAEAVGLGFTSLPATLTALEAEVLGAPAQAAPPAQPAEPAAAPAPAQPAADSDSDGFELTGSQTEAERTAAAREEAERRNAVVDVDDDDDDLAGQSVKTLKAMAAARGVDVSTCREKSEISRRCALPRRSAGRGARRRRRARAAAVGRVKRLTRRIISSALKDGASLYDVLGIESSATVRDVTVAYRDIAALIHPDKCAEANASEAFKKVNEANSVLSDAARRAIYDAEQARAARRRPRRRAGRRKRPKRKAAKRKKKKNAKKKRKAPSSDDDDDSFIADSDDEEEEESEADSDSDSESEEEESEDDEDVIGGSDDDDDEEEEESDEESDEAPARRRAPAAAPRRAGRRPRRRRDSSSSIHTTSLPRRVRVPPRAELLRAVPPVRLRPVLAVLLEAPPLLLRHGLVVHVHREDAQVHLRLRLPPVLRDPAQVHLRHDDDLEPVPLDGPLLHLQAHQRGQGGRLDDVRRARARVLSSKYMTPSTRGTIIAGRH